MKKKIITYLAKYFYPQIIFAKSIVLELTKKKNISVIIDAPCGNGETTYHLSKMKNAKVFGYDISEKSIAHAKEFFANRNLQYECSNIFDVFMKHKKVNVFCMINSFFLLPQQELILRKIHQLLNDDGWLILILPNIEGRNYHNFLSEKKNRNINSLVLSPSQFSEYFQQQGFEIKKMKGIVYAHYYKRRDTKFMSVFSHFYLSFLNAFQSLLTTNQPNYYILVLTKR